MWRLSIACTCDLLRSLLASLNILFVCLFTIFLLYCNYFSSLYPLTHRYILLYQFVFSISKQIFVHFFLYFYNETEYTRTLRHFLNYLYTQSYRLRRYSKFEDDCKILDPKNNLGWRKKWSIQKYKNYSACDYRSFLIIICSRIVAMRIIDHKKFPIAFGWLSNWHSYQNF